MSARVSHLVLAETTWALSAVYDRDPAAIAMAVEMLLNHQHLTVQDPDVVAAAVVHLRKRPALGFSDCLMLEVAHKAGHVPLGTFDRDLARLDGAERVSRIPRCRTTGSPAPPPRLTRSGAARRSRRLVACKVQS